LKEHIAWWAAILWYHVHVSEERTTRHRHYNLDYHLVFIPKYRRHAFFDEVRERLMQVLRETYLMRDWVVPGMEVMPDHVHLFLSVAPKWSSSDVTKIVKGVSARRILKEFLRLRRGRGDGHLWTPSFYVGSAGSISAQAIQRYIESQRKCQDDDA